jgi:hypothetical protein
VKKRGKTQKAGTMLLLTKRQPRLTCIIRAVTQTNEESPKKWKIRLTSTEHPYSKMCLKNTVYDQHVSNIVTYFAFDFHRASKMKHTKWPRPRGGGAREGGATKQGRWRRRRGGRRRGASEPKWIFGWSQRATFLLCMVQKWI